MAMAMLMAGRTGAEPAVGPAAAGRLADLGITRVSLVEDHDWIGVVLEGWAFDPARTHEAVRAVFPSGSAGVRILREIELVSVSASSAGRGI